MVYYVEYLTEHEDIEEWLGKNSNSEKLKEYYDRMGEFGYKLVRAFNKLFSKNMPYQNLVQQGDRKEFITFY